MRAAPVRALFLFLGFVLAIAGLAPHASASEAPDTAVPVVEAIDVNPSTVDVREGAQVVTVTLRITDESGYDNTTGAWVAERDDTGHRVADSQGLERIYGTATDGVYRAEFTVPESALSGTWRFIFWAAADVLGNHTYYRSADPAFQVVSAVIPGEPPVVESVELSRDVVDLRSESRDLTVTMRITDDKEGYDPTTGLWLVEKRAGQRAADVTGLSRVSGTPLDGVYEARFSIPQTAEPGRWRFVLRYLKDTAGNTTAGLVVDRYFSVASGPPASVAKPTAMAGNGSAWVAWSPPEDNGAPVTAYTVTSSPGGASTTVPGDHTSATVGGLSNGTGYAFTVTAANALGTSPQSPPSDEVVPEAPDTAAPVVSEFDFTPKSVEVNDGEKQVTVSVRLVDASGAKTPTMILASESTSQSLGFGSMTRVSGDAKDGVYERTVTIPTTAAAGGWNVRLYPVEDTVGNSSSTFRTHPVKLSVTNTPQDTAAPVVSEFDFTPKSVEVNDGEKQVTVSVRLVDASGAKTPTMILASESTSQSLGFGSMTRVSGDAKDGVYERTVTIPTTAAAGGWNVRLYPVEDTVGNSSSTFRTHPVKLSVTNTPQDAAAPVVSEFDFTPKSVEVNDGEKQVTVSVRLVDASGAKTPTMILASESTSQSLGFGSMTRVSGDAKDGVYERTVTIPTTAAAGGWNVRLYPVEDTVGNSSSTFRTHPVKLSVTNTPQDAAAPVVSEFDFTPKSVEVNDGEKQVTVSVRLVDASGAKTPTMILASESTSQSLGFGSMTRVSGDAKDGVYERTVTIPTTAAAGGWNVRLYPVEDTVGNSSSTFRTHPVKLSVTNTPSATAPEAPSEITADALDGAARVMWSAPHDGGSPITTYTITSSPGGDVRTFPGDVTDAIVDGLSNGTAYTFTVAATNAVGVSESSAHSVAVTPAAAITVPGAPREVRAEVGDGAATVMWAAPDSDGGSPVTSYTVTASPGGRTVTVAGTATQAEVEGLENGTAYTFTVVAANDIGTSSSSGPSESVTPAGAPDRPAKPVVKVKRDKLVVKWTAPESNGSPISAYVVAVSKGRSVTTTGTRTKVVIRKARPGNYKIRVAAVSDVGTSAKSAVVRVRVAR